MNENLFQLGLDAHIKAAEIADSDPVAEYEGKIWQNIYRTKFAELIIEECIKLNYESDNLTTSQKVSFENKMRNHFGIE